GKAGALQLHRSVLNRKILRSLLLDRGEELFTFVEVHVRNAGVQAEGMVIAAERPEVHVVDFLDAFDGENGARDFFDAQFAGTAFEKNVRGFAQDADAGQKEEKADGKAKKRVDPMRAGGVNDDGADDDG